jgi:hypothetical protein
MDSYVASHYRKERSTRERGRRPKPRKQKTKAMEAKAVLIQAAASVADPLVYVAAGFQGFLEAQAQ